MHHSDLVCQISRDRWNNGPPQPKIAKSVAVFFESHVAAARQCPNAIIENSDVIAANIDVITANSDVIAAKVDRDAM